MSFHDPILLAVIGAVIVILSVVISELVIAKIEKQVQELDSEILELSRLQASA